MSASILLPMTDLAIRSFSRLCGALLVTWPCCTGKLSLRKCSMAGPRMPSGPRVQKLHRTLACVALAHPSFIRVLYNKRRRRWPAARSLSLSLLHIRPKNPLPLVCFFAVCFDFLSLASPCLRWFSGAEPASAVAERLLISSHKRTCRSSDRALFDFPHGFALVEI